MGYYKWIDKNQQYIKSVGSIPDAVDMFHFMFP